MRLPPRSETSPAPGRISCFGLWQDSGAAAEVETIMGKPRFTLCLVFATCAWLLAPEVRDRAGGEGAGEPQEQWRIFPHPPFARPASEEVTSRITRQVDRFAVLYRPEGSNRSVETLGDSLVDSKARIQLFRLESLLRLYVKAFPDLEKYRLEVKDVEDGLGDYTFAVDSLDFAKDKFKDENRSRPPDAARKAERSCEPFVQWLPGDCASVRRCETR